MAKSIMVMGTMSNAGKSILTAGLCRILYEMGYKVAPFKSQNMALNSFITKEGLEMGRAQAVQAMACNIEPSVLMNPILLKPTNDTGSQVIVNGLPKKTMNAREYYAYKKNLIPDVKKAYEKLSKENEIIVIEGAGSPAEINLREDDIVNMGMAQMADAPVVLVGDIDRGGVFAQLVGTVMLLTKEERERIKGLVINKFRGDKTILDPGIKMLEEQLDIPVLGVIPYLDVDIEEEDSLSERFSKRKSDNTIKIAVIKTPRMSNYTDFFALESNEHISLSYVNRPVNLDDMDMIILPGTKNTQEDLKWLFETGIAARIKKAHGKNKIIFGICGGYQMLGEEITDPLGVEKKGSVKGLGLLPVSTQYQDNKTLTRVTGTTLSLEGDLAPLSNLTISGYEIHMGRTKVLNGCKSFAKVINQINGETYVDGAALGQVYGTYIHGVFDGDGVAASLVTALAKKKGIELKTESISIDDYRNEQFDILAAAIRDNMDIERLKQIIFSEE